VSGCTALEELRCFNGQLTELKTGANTSLRLIEAANNDIRSIDLRSCRAINSIQLGNNRNLTAIDATGCAALSALSCPNTALTSLRLGGCTSLRSLNCAKGGLTALDVKDCSALSTLDCSGNGIRSLDFSGNPYLNDLKCNGNALTSLDLSKTPRLSVLYCSDNGITALDVSPCYDLWYALQYGAMTEFNGGTYGKAVRYVVSSRILFVPADTEFGQEPGEPTKLTAEPTDDGIIVKWTLCPRATSFCLERQTDGGEWKPLADAITRRVYTDADAPEGSVCRYRVRGKNATGAGPWLTGEEITVPQRLPGKIASVTAKAEAGRTAVTWTAGDRAKAYIIQRRVKDGDVWTTLASNVTALRFEDTTGAAGTVYQYRVRGRNGAKYGPFQFSSVVRALAGTPAPGAIASVTATASAGKITVKWAAATNAPQYIIQRRVKDDTVWTTLKSNVAATSYEDTTGTAGTIYQYRVRGRNGTTYGPFKLSSVARFIAGSTAKTPGAISSVTATPTAGKITLKWAKAANATQYLIQRQVNGGTWATLATVSTLTCTDAKVTKGTVYRYRIRPKNASGYGSFKVSGSVTAK